MVSTLALSSIRPNRQQVLAASWYLYQRQAQSCHGRFFPLLDQSGVLLSLGTSTSLSETWFRERTRTFREDIAEKQQREQRRSREVAEKEQKRAERSRDARSKQCCLRFISSWEGPLEQWRHGVMQLPAKTVEAQSCGPWNQRLSNYQNKSCKSYPFSFNCLKGKCANLNHSNIDIGGQAAKTSKSEFRRGGISPPKASSSTHVRNTATATAQAQVTKHIGKMAWPRTGLEQAQV